MVITLEMWAVIEKSIRQAYINGHSNKESYLNETTVDAALMPLNGELIKGLSNILVNEPKQPATFTAIYKNRSDKTLIVTMMLDRIKNEFECATKYIYPMPIQPGQSVDLTFSEGESFTLIVEDVKG